MIIALRIGADMKMNGTCRLTASNPIAADSFVTFNIIFITKFDWYIEMPKSQSLASNGSWPRRSLEKSLYSEHRSM